MPSCDLTDFDWDLPAKRARVRETFSFARFEGQVTLSQAIGVVNSFAVAAFARNQAFLEIDLWVSLSGPDEILSKEPLSLHTPCCVSCLLMGRNMGLVRELRRVRSRGSAVAEKFVADAMLGKLAKWLRIMGYDTLYQSRYEPGRIQTLVREGRILLMRNTRSGLDREVTIFILSDHVGEQLRQLKKEGCLAPDRARWFTRCMLCNEILREPPAEAARENVPEYVFFEHPKGIHWCPSCGRFFWPGSHRQRMVAQLQTWGF